MRIGYFLGLLCLLGYLPAQAEETQTQPTIAALINQVQEAPDHKKRELINQLKMRLRTMSQVHRQRAMQALRKSFAKSENPNVQQAKKKTPRPSCGRGEGHQPKFRHLHQQRQHRGGRG